MTNYATVILPCLNTFYYVVIPGSLIFLTCVYVTFLLQDEHYKSVVRYNETKEVAEKCLYLLKNNFDKSCSIFSVEKIKAVAAVRYCLSQLADTLSQLLQNENEKALTKDWKEVVEYIQGKFTLLEAKYPAEYFIKYIVRQYGIEVFSTLRISYPWIVPEQLDSKKPKVHISDLCIMFHCIYVTVSGKTSLIARSKKSRNSSFKYSECCNLPMVVATHAKFSHILQQFITFQIIH